MYRFSVSLQPPPDFRPKGFGGFVAYSVVMDILESEDPELVRLRRTGKLQTDFSLRPLRSEGGALVLDVTAFTEEVSSALRSAILEGRIITRHGEFEILRVDAEEVDPDEIMGNSSPVRKFSLSFRTPTFFRPRSGVRGGVFIPLPLPDRMIIGLHRTWNHFLGPMEDELERKEFHQWLESWGIVVSGHRIKTVKIDDGNKFEVGFVGWTNFSANQAYEDPSFLRKVDALLRLGEIVNVGGLRSKGFGVITYRRSDRPRGRGSGEVRLKELRVLQ